MTWNLNIPYLIANRETGHIRFDIDIHDQHGDLCATRTAELAETAHATTHATELAETTHATA